MAELWQAPPGEDGASGPRLTFAVNMSARNTCQVIMVLFPSLSVLRTARNYPKADITSSTSGFLETALPGKIS